jgi:murein DD-endopeptidase MepM/ murein hydrolase activator NlpD
MPNGNTILNYQKNPQPIRPTRFILLAGAVAAMFFGVVTAFGTTSDTITYSGELHEVLDRLAVPEAQLVGTNNRALSREFRIQQGDTVASLLSRMNIRDAEAVEFLRNNQDTDALFRQLSPGKTLTAQVKSDGGLESLLFPLNGGKDTALLIQRTTEGFNAKVQNLRIETRVTLQTAVINRSLFGAADDAGIPDAVAMQLVDIFGGDVDFHRDLRKGDRFSVIYESINHFGKPVRSERILATELTNAGKTYRAFWFNAKDGTSGYYTAEGRSIKKAFLRSPLEFSRITSGFSAARYHPVLQEIRAHRGLDYAAPTGTRVKATGNGVVEFVGNKGGYGKVIMLRHAGDKATVYGHLSGFASGIKMGTRVTQGDIIGFVGATGLATGPHLHYEFKVAGEHRNPLTVALPNTMPLSQDQLLSFHTNVEELISKLDHIGNFQLVMLD